MKVTVTVCNICQDPQLPTEAYEVRGQGRLVKVDLCKGDAEPLEAFLKDAKPRGRPPVKKTAKRAAKKTSTSRGRKARVTSMEEIEKLKQG